MLTLVKNNKNIYLLIKHIMLLATYEVLGEESEIMNVNHNRNSKHKIFPTLSV
jgi:hypothetical protein